MLRTHTHIPSKCVHILAKDFIAVNVCLTFTGLHHSSQNLQRARFASTIMAKQSENLTLVHSNIDSIYCVLTIRVYFSEILNLKEASFLFHF